MEIQSIMTRNVVALNATDTLAMAAQLMSEEEVGCILVHDENRRPVGILTGHSNVAATIAGASRLTK
jgi:CBS domain-containing protein